MADRNFVLVAGDTEPSLELHVRRRQRPVDLTGYQSATVTITREGHDTITRDAVIDADPTTGIIRMSWHNGDLVDNGGKTALYKAEIRLVDGDDGEEHNPDIIRFYVRPQLS